jgi:hypothetical protein
VSNAGSSAFLFPFSVFFHRGRIAHAAHLPHLPPRTSQTLSSPPPSSRRGSPARATAASLLQNPTSRLPAPTAESSGACCGLCRIHLPSPSGRRASRSALAAAGGAACCGSRGRLLRCALSRRVFSLSTPSRKDRSRSACLGFGPLSILANLGSQSMTEMASWILIHGDVEHLGDFYFHQGNFTIHIGTGR